MVQFEYPQAGPYTSWPRDLIRHVEIWCTAPDSFIPISFSDSGPDDYEDYEDLYTMHVVPLSPPDGDPSANWQWCLLTLAGNATILQLRKEDFVRYLKMNLASLIGTYCKPSTGWPSASET